MGINHTFPERSQFFYSKARDQQKSYSWKYCFTNELSYYNRKILDLYRVKQSLIFAKSYSYCLLRICLYSLKPLLFYTFFNCWLECCFRLPQLLNQLLCRSFFSFFKILHNTRVARVKHLVPVLRQDASSLLKLIGTSQQKFSDPASLQTVSLFVLFSSPFLQAISEISENVK